MNDHLWNPKSSEIKETQMNQFMELINKKNPSLHIDSYHKLHSWSVENANEFWTELFSFFKINYSGSLNPASLDLSFENYSWFSDVKLNFAENLLNKVNSEGKRENIALSFLHESGQQFNLTYGELISQANNLQFEIKEYLDTKNTNSPKGGVACYMPNIPETVVSMLAASSLGKSFTSTSSDFGVEGVVDRFSQARPKVFIAAIGYSYGGKYFDQLEKIKKITKAIDSIEKVILVDFLSSAVSEGLVKRDAIDRESIKNEIPNGIFLDEIAHQESELTFTKVSFDTPLYIMYSSGTTGKPKCIVHSHGGTLLQHVKEHGLHCDLKESDNLFYFTTCGWMMWNWLVSGLYFGGKVTLYEGSPGYPSINDFLLKLENEKINILGTSPKFLKVLEDSGYDKDITFNSVRLILSTGAPLLPEQFDFVYEKFIPHAQLASICGGTDIIGCFMLGNPILPVKRGEIQCLALGMDVATFDEQGQEVLQKEGELVCRKSFPSRPIYFLDDEDKQRINDAYFNRFKNVWHHGDFITITENKGVFVYGRSDATLNPGGVRIGTSEIYRQTELLSYIEDSLCVGRPLNGDVEIILFVKLKEGHFLDDDKVKEIKTEIRKNTTPRHVPAFIKEVDGIPYTRSGKKMEMAITRLLQGRELTNIEAVSNPECLGQYQQINKEL